MIKIITRQTWNNIQGELSRLRKVRPIAEALERKGIRAEDILESRVHIRKNPRRFAK